VLGPRQVEAAINQEPEISAQITLWSQSGSEVIRGNLLVIPIGSGLLYVQPLYLRATNTEAAFPKLQRVIVATNEQVVMRPTLDEALAAVVALGSEVTGPIDETVPGESTSADEGTSEPPSGDAPSGDAPSEGVLAEQALAAYERGREALARGDWAAYGVAQAELEAILRDLAAAEPAATPAP
jgi:uncharacterized membrane protein (UPF0182 family)